MAYIFWTLVVLFFGLLIHSTIKRRQFVSFTQRRLHEVKGIILQITYNATDGQENCHVVIFRGSIGTGKRKYERIIDNALEIKTYLERL